jgi:hypothetical protein
LPVAAAKRHEPCEGRREIGGDEGRHVFNNEGSMSGSFGRFGFMIVLTMLLGVTPGAAQLAGLAGTPVGVEGRLFAAIPTGDFGNNLGTGLGWGVEGTFNFTPRLAVYGGYSRAEFDVEGTGAGEVRDAGLNLGLRGTLPALGPLSPFLRGGLVYHELSGARTSDDELGFELGGGIAVPISPRLSINPALSYLQYSPDSGSNVSYLSLGASLMFRF